MSEYFIDINQTTDIAELQAIVREVQHELSLVKLERNRLRDEITYLKQSLESKDRMIEQMNDIIQIYENTMQSYQSIAEDCLGVGVNQDSGQVSTTGYKSHLNHGIGVSYSKEHGPNVCRVSDPSGPMIPDLEFQQAELEIGRGEGIHFGIHWKKRRK